MADFLVLRNRRNTIVFFCCAYIWQKDATRKTDFFDSLFLENMKKDRTLFNTPKHTCVPNLELFWQCSILAKNSYMYICTGKYCPFSTEPFNCCTHFLLWNLRYQYTPKLTIFSKKLVFAFPDTCRFILWSFI